MIAKFLIILGLPTLISLIITPWVIRLAKLVGAIDKPNERKVHTSPTPRLGGVVLYASFFVSIAVLVWAGPALHLSYSMLPHRWVMLITSLVLVLALGIWDDIRPLTARQKFFVQLIAGTIVYLAGYRLSSVTDLFGEGVLNLGILDYPATLLWIVGITNAINLIDGLDGLASGVAIMASLSMVGVSYLKHDMATGVASLILAGSVLGFLRYNFNPAKIFLGDSGSLFLGFVISVLSIQGSTKGSTAFAILVPVLALGLPIMDVFLSMTRRFLRSFLPKQPTNGSLVHRFAGMFRADRGHIHHQLLKQGLSERKAVLFLYVVSCTFGVVAFAVTVANGLVSSFILMAVAIATVVGIKKLQYREMAILENGVLLPIYEWPLMNHTLFQGFIDLAFIGIAYFGAYAMTSAHRLVTQTQEQFLSELVGILVIQILVFSLTGMYKTSFRTLGLRDALNIAKSTAFAVLVAHLLVFLVANEQRQLDPLRMILNFYFLLSLVLGLRLSFAALKILSRKADEGKKRVLIYGADSNSMLIFQKILQDDDLDMSVLGFLDEAPELEGKLLNGYPIFGGHRKLERILHQKKVDEILICSEFVKPEVLKRLKSISLEQRIPIKRPVIQMEEFSPGAGVTKFPRPTSSFARENTSPVVGFDPPAPAAH